MISTKIQAFEMKNLPQVIDVVVPLWSPPLGDANFKRFNVEFIVRNNISENDYRFELVDEKGNFLAAAFFYRKGDKCLVEDWFSKESGRFSESLLKAANMSRVYLNSMDQRTASFMKDDDIKLSLFVSRQKGAGATILNKMSEILYNEGWKTLYLWTDCDCNWQWYEKHGFELVWKGKYEPFSNEHEEYMTYIYRKTLHA